MKVIGVAFVSVVGKFFVSDSEPLIYRWNESLNLWCWYCYREEVGMTEERVMDLHCGEKRRVTVEASKLASGIKSK